MWQDIVFGLGSCGFIVALLPMLWSEHAPPLCASVPTATISFAFGYAYLTLDLKFACFTTLIQGILWASLALQKWSENE